MYWRGRTGLFGEGGGLGESKQMKTKIYWLSLCTLLFALSVPVAAQQAARIPRIGFVTSGGNPNSPGLRVEAFQRGLRELGYVEGKNILVEYRYIEGKTERVPVIVSELLRLKVDVLVSTTLATVRAAKQETHTIPIVVVIPDDPVALGLVHSLARPGGNITGLTRLSRDLSGKRLELLTEVLAGISRVAVLWGSSATNAPRPGQAPFQD